MSEAGEAVEDQGGPMEKRWMVKRGVAISEGEENRAVFDYLLDEEACGRLRGSADAGAAETMKGQERDDETDRHEDGGEAGRRAHWE